MTAAVVQRQQHANVNVKSQTLLNLRLRHLLYTRLLVVEIKLFSEDYKLYQKLVIKWFLKFDNKMK